MLAVFLHKILLSAAQGSLVAALLPRKNRENLHRSKYVTSAVLLLGFSSVRSKMCQKWLGMGFLKSVLVIQEIIPLWEASRLGQDTRCPCVGHRGAEAVALQAFWVLSCLEGHQQDSEPPSFGSGVK